MSWSLPFITDKPLRMVWKVQKDASCSYLVGTAHFFPYGFSRSLRRILKDVDIVLTEGPLDEDSLGQIADNGRDGGFGVNLGELLDPNAVGAINRLLEKRLAAEDGNRAYLLYPLEKLDYFAMFTQEARLWMAFFSIWTTCLGWEHSVDREAYQLALRMGKPVQAIESLQEQLAVLNGISLERVLRQLGDVRNWDVYQRDYVRLYLEGSLEQLVSLTNHFPTRTPAAIGERDRVMFSRLKPVFESRRAAAFIGFPHIPGVRRLFLEDGCQVSQGVG